jgi:DNA polymerase-1
MRTALLDADVICYQAAASAQRDYGTEIWADIKHAIEDAETQVFKEMEQANCEQVMLVWSPKNGSNWRKLVMPAYKMHRKSTPKPICYGELRDEMSKRFDHLAIDWLEGDDLMAMLEAKVPNSVVVSIDKDMFTLPDLEYLRPHTMAFPTYTSRDYADYYWLYQVLIGDSTDGYKGLMGCGPKKAEKLLSEFMEIGIDDNGQQTHDFDFDGAWNAVVNAYREKGQMNWLEQAQMARILRVGDYDSKNKRVRLFNPDKVEWLQLPKD